MVKMKYKSEYLSTGTKIKFKILMKSTYPHLKESTIERRFYDLKKALGNQPKVLYFDYMEVKKPNHTKMLELQDMINMRIRISRENLMKYGFKYDEVNWIQKNGMLEGEK